MRHGSTALACSLLLLPAPAAAQGGAPPPAPSATGALPLEPPPSAPPGAASAPAPAPAPAPTPPPPVGTPPPPVGTPPPPGGYPPAGGYEYPPPGYGYGYPPPGYYYPPPGYGYGYGYGYAPPPKPRPVFPDDAAGQTTPYIDIVLAGVAVDKRYDHFFTVGVQAGAYFASRIRLVARAVLFTTEPDDDMANDFSYDEEDSLPEGYVGVASERPTLLLGGAIGVAPVVRRNFIFAPGIAFATTDVGDYGSTLMLSLPFEWVTDDATRFGFEVDIGRAFGGKVSARCEYDPCSPTGQEREFDRPAAPAFFAAFQMGWGFNHPPAKYPQSPGVP